MTPAWWGWPTKYADGVVLVAYVFALVAILGDPFGLVGFADGSPAQRRTVRTVIITVFTAAGVQALYAGVYVLTHRETAVENHIRPVTLRLGHGADDRFHRRMTRYDDVDGARRAGL